MKRLLTFSILLLLTISTVFSQNDFAWPNLPSWTNRLSMEPIQEENIYLSVSADKNMTKFGEAIKKDDFPKADSLRGLIFKPSVSLATFQAIKGKIWVLLKDNSPMAVQVVGGVITFHRLEISLDSPKKYRYKKPSYVWYKESQKLQNIGNSSLFNLYFLKKGALSGEEIIFHQSDNWKRRNIRTAQLLVRYHIKGDKKSSLDLCPL